MSNDDDPRVALEPTPKEPLRLATTALKRVDTSRLIKVGDQQGIFTPLTKSDQPEGSSDNLETVIDALREDLLALTEENQTLRQQIAALEAAGSRTPDDFASAVSHTLDTLQSRLSETKNPVSRFAVRNFSIEANVYVDVSPLGTIDYRFTRPGDAVDPARLSKLKLDLVPLPKEDRSGSWTHPEFTPFIDVEEVQGIGEEYKKRLNAQQIYTVGDLLSAATRVRTQAQLAATLRVQREHLAQWLVNAELMTIKDIDGRQAEVLAGLGINSLDALAAQEPETLAAAYNAQVASAGVDALRPVTPAQVKTWIDTAAAYAGRVARPNKSPA